MVARGAGAARSLSATRRTATAGGGGRAVAARRHRQGTGALEDGYATLLDEEPDSDRLGAGGAALFAVGAILLGADDARLSQAGRVHAFASAARRGLAAIPDDAMPADLAGHRFARALRPLTAFARLAARDVRRAPMLEAEATPARALALLSHRLFGTIS